MSSYLEYEVSYPEPTKVSLEKKALTAVVVGEIARNIARTAVSPTVNLSNPDSLPYRLLNNSGDFYIGCLGTCAINYLLSKTAPRLSEQIRLGTSALIGSGLIALAETSLPQSIYEGDSRDILAGFLGAAFYIGINRLQKFKSHTQPFPKS